jgi:hypothetical protein
MLNKNLFFSFIALFIVLLSACNNGTEEINNVPKEETMDNVYPFDKAVSVEVFSYEGSFDTVSAFSDYLSKNFESLAAVNILNDTNLHIKDRIKLTTPQKQQLFDILYKENCADALVGNCFNPNHAIVYYDHTGKAFAYTEISLDCMNAVSSKEVGNYKFCDSKIEKLTQFFKSIGIHYFGDVLMARNEE